MRPKKALCLFVGAVMMLCGCSGADVLNATIPTSGYHVVKNIAYAESDRHKLDIYIPDISAPGHPVIVFFYGGSWQQGSKDDYLFVGQAFASQGITTVIADYRLYPEVYFPAFMDDCANAVVWTHNHIGEYGGDAHNLFVAGHSAGGYNAVMLALNRDYLKAAGGNARWIKGVIGIAGPYDFLPLVDPKLIEIFSQRDVSTSQPITYARAHAPPMLLLTGAEDQDVLPRNSYNLAKKLGGFEDSVSVETYPGVAHVGIVVALADGFRSKAPVLEDIAHFVSSLTEK